MILFLGCKKKDSITASPIIPTAASYTAAMAGSRIWHGRSNGYIVTVDSAVNFTFHRYDSTVNHAIDLTVIDSATISFQGYTLHIDSTNTNSHLTYYTDARHSYRYGQYTYVIYYYLADSMRYSHSYLSTHSSNDNTTLSSP